MEKNKNNVIQKIIDNSLIFMLIIICILGYPLNNLIFGFHYLGISILITLILFYLIERINFKKKNQYLIISIILFSFSIFTSYYMFVPIAYGSCGLYYLYKWFPKKEITLKKSIKYIVVTLCISFLIGLYMYILSKMLFSSGETTSGLSTFTLEGYIYRNLLGNIFILFIFSCYIFIKNIINKEINVFDISLIMTTIFMIIISLGMCLGNFGT